MWALVENNSVTQVYTRPKAITIGDVNYPQNIFMLWSSDELEALGIYEVVVDNSNLKDPAYYINTNQTFAFADGVVTASYGTATARQLDDSTDPDTGVVTHGLKYNHNQIIDQQAYGLLQPNDWYVVRNQEAGTEIPADWSTFRSGVRSTAADMVSKINACTTVDELAALYQYNDAEPPVRPLGEFPQSPDSSV
ncbi:hypothetical protein OAV94_01065 [Candidatus Pelagibacter sp.]|nr:hypothetical protein [Candidatus Pelagibacter sp.]